MSNDSNGCGTTFGCGCFSFIVVLIVGGVAMLFGVPLLKVAAIAAIIVGLFALVGLGIDILRALLS